jgi:hypothetical protein
MVLIDGRRLDGVGHRIPVRYLFTPVGLLGTDLL